jgi:predicted dehydrogenase
VRRPINYAVTGCGFLGSAQAAMIRGLDHARLVVVHSRTMASAQRVADANECEATTDLDRVLERDDVDALIVATPNHRHRQPVIDAARRGKHVFCEKPFALSLEDADEMLRACRQAGVTLQVGHMMRFYPGLQQVKRLIEEGHIGRPLVAHVERTGWEHPQGSISWKKQRACSGGHLFHHIHEIDLLLWLLGMVRSVFAIGGNLAHSGPGFGDEDDVVLMTLEFHSGAVGSMQYGSGFRWGEHLMKINGESGAIFLDNKRSSIGIMDGHGAVRQLPLFDDPASNESMIGLFRRTDGGVAYGRPGEPLAEYLYQAIRTELEYFNDVLLGRPIDPDKADLFSGAAARASIEVAQGALEAMARGQPKKLPLTA